MDSSGQNTFQLTEGKFDVTSPKWGREIEHLPDVLNRYVHRHMIQLAL